MNPFMRWTGPFPDPFFARSDDCLWRPLSIDFAADFPVEFVIRKLEDVPLCPRLKEPEPVLALDS